MTFEGLSLIAVVVLLVTTLLLLLSPNWRLSIAALAVQYLAVFWLTALMWPFGLAVVKLVGGWMAGAVLGASQPASEEIEDPYTNRSALVFRLLVAFSMWVLVFLAAPLLTAVLPVSLTVSQGALLLIGMGILHLGTTTRPLRVLIGLLTTLSGFEVLYAGLERSVMVAGLLAMITLGLALVGAYLLAVHSTKSGVS